MTNKFNHHGSYGIHPVTVWFGRLVDFVAGPRSRDALHGEPASPRGQDYGLEITERRIAKAEFADSRSVRTPRRRLRAETDAARETIEQTMSKTRELTNKFESWHPQKLIK